MVLHEPRINVDSKVPERADEEMACERQNAAISQASIDARVAPGDPTYSGEAPHKVCYSALAYTLSLG